MGIASGQNCKSILIYYNEGLHSLYHNVRHISSFCDWILRNTILYAIWQYTPIYITEKMCYNSSVIPYLVMEDANEKKCKICSGYNSAS